MTIIHLYLYLCATKQLIHVNTPTATPSCSWGQKDLFVDTPGNWGNILTGDCATAPQYIEARHGSWLSPFSERVKMKVVATSSRTCKVVVESSSRSVLNLLNFGANKDNISALSDYINNEVYKLVQPSEIPMSNQEHDHSTIRITPPKIRFWD